MTSELLRKATEVTVAASESGALVPLNTSLTHLMGERGSCFELRHLLSATPKHLRASWPKPNPFLPWDQRLEVGQIGDSHVLILNKYPVQTSHMLLITKDWQPQTGWLSMEDWHSLAQIDTYTTGLWFFNSGPDAGASQPHRHLQLLPRAEGERICARDDWFRRCAEGITTSAEDPLLRSARVEPIRSTLTGETLQQQYLAIAKDLGLGHPTTDNRPRGPTTCCSHGSGWPSFAAEGGHSWFQRQCSRLRRILIEHRGLRSRMDSTFRTRGPAASSC